MLDLEAALSPAQAARLVGVTPQRLRQLMGEGKLQYVMTPLGRLLDRREVDALVEKRQVVAQDRRPATAG